MKEYYLIDGYNVINNWPEFARVRNQDLEHARAMLTDKVAEFSAFHGYEAVIVFDAMETKGPEATEFIAGCTVVFTAEQETADSWIERETYRISKKGVKVFVVTSDKAEQDNVLGSGALRIPAREFRELYYKTKEEIEEKIGRLPGNTGRREIGGRIGGDVALYLERLRRR